MILELPYPPSVNHYYCRRATGGVFIGAHGRDYRDAVIWIAKSLGAKPVHGRLRVRIEAFPPDNRRRDIDNIFKCLLDSLQHAGLYKDDSQIKELHCKMFDKSAPDGCVIVEVEQIHKPEWLERIINSVLPWLKKKETDNV